MWRLWRRLTCAPLSLSNAKLKSTLPIKPMMLDWHLCVVLIQHEHEFDGQILIRCRRCMHPSAYWISSGSLYSHQKLDTNTIKLCYTLSPVTIPTTSSYFSFVFFTISSRTHPSPSHPSGPLSNPAITQLLSTNSPQTVHQNCFTLSSPQRPILWRIRSEKLVDEDQGG